MRVRQQCCNFSKVGWFFGLCRRARSGVVKKWHDFFVKRCFRTANICSSADRVTAINAKKWHDFFTVNVIRRQRNGSSGRLKVKKWHDFYWEWQEYERTLFSPLVTGPAAKWLKSAPLFRLNGITFRGFRIKR